MFSSPAIVDPPAIVEVDATLTGCLTALMRRYTFLTQIAFCYAFMGLGKATPVPGLIIDTDIGGGGCNDVDDGH